MAQRLRAYDLCQCGKVKSKVSPHCWACRYKVPEIPQPDDPNIRYIPLTHGYVATVWTIDYERVKQHKWHAGFDRRKDGSIKNVYAIRTIYDEAGKKHRCCLHRVVMNVIDPDIQIDHNDHDGLNCCQDNLRVATGTQNNGNRRVSRNNTSGFKGVTHERRSGKRKRFAAQFKPKDASHRLYAYFYTAEEAAHAYDVAALNYFGRFACTNFSQTDYIERNGTWQFNSPLSISAPVSIVCFQKISPSDQN